MNCTTVNIEKFLATTAPFNRLSPIQQKNIIQKIQLLRYRVGQAILTREKMPALVHILFKGKARLLGYEPKNNNPVNLKLIQPGEILGWVGLVRNIACETVIASSEVICLTIPAVEFLEILQNHKAFASYFQERASLIEVFEVLGAQLQQQANHDLIMGSLGVDNLKDLALKASEDVQVVNDLATIDSRNMNSKQLWLISGGKVPKEAIGNRFDTHNQRSQLPPGSQPRLLGFPTNMLLRGTELICTHKAAELETKSKDELPPTTIDIPYAPADIPELEDTFDSNFDSNNSGNKQYPYIRAQGRVSAVLACFGMLTKYLGIPFRKEVVRKVLVSQEQRSGGISLQHCGAIGELLGLKAQLMSVPPNAVGRIDGLAIVQWQDSFALLYEVSPKKIILAVPQVGILKERTENVAQILVQSVPTQEGQQQINGIPVLILQPTRDTPHRNFGLSWFLPSLIKYRRVLLEVFIASFFVQLFGLANPLMTQTIIDKVLNQNSPDTLQILGLFLLVVALFEAILTSIRTYLFVDTTNRIDMVLGSEIIDHLLRLPLRYFEKRPVGELSTRVNELEKIRQFLTGTALTVVLDAVFSGIYIVVMFIYSWILALVALSTLPFFALLTLVFSPIVRRQLRTKAERNAQAQSHLVEVLSGIETVKAQNIELRSRWKWQERYARYVSAGFKTVLTSTAASSSSGFLNKLSGLLVLWVGAHLVLQGELTLGQLIAFRIIAGYVTTPLLRLTQLWQNFQETALSLERLSDIVDSPQEATEEDRGNIPMPAIKGPLF